MAKFGLQVGRLFARGNPPLIGRSSLASSLQVKRSNLGPLSARPHEIAASREPFLAMTQHQAGRCLAVRPDELADLGVGLGLPSAAMEHAKMTDLKLEEVALFRRNDAAAEPVRGNGLAGPADIVALALDRHQRGALDGRRFDRLAP